MALHLSSERTVRAQMSLRDIRAWVDEMLNDLEADATLSTFGLEKLEGLVAELRRVELTGR